MSKGQKYEKERIALLAAGEVLGIPPQNLDISIKEGITKILLVNYPMIMTGDPKKELKPGDLERIKNAIIDLKKNIGFVVSENTPFKDQPEISSNMLSAFLNLMTLKNYFPNLEVLMPEGIEEIKPGILYPKQKKIKGIGTFSAKIYLPPDPKSLNDQISVAFALKSRKSNKTHHGIVNYSFR